MTITVKPTKGKVFIRPEQHKPVDTFLALPDTVVGRDMPDRGTIFAIGAKRKFKNGDIEDLGFKVGDRVFFKKFTGLWVDVYGEPMIQLAQHDVMAVLG